MTPDQHLQQSRAYLAEADALRGRGGPNDGLGSTTPADVARAHLAATCAVAHLLTATHQHTRMMLDKALEVTTESVTPTPHWLRALNSAMFLTTVLLIVWFLNR